MHIAVGQEVGGSFVDEAEFGQVAQPDLSPQDEDATAGELCPDPTEPSVSFVCREVSDLREVSHLFASEPSPEDLVYDALKASVEAGNVRAAIKNGKQLAMDLPQGPTLASNMIMRAFPGSRRARRTVKSIAAATQDPLQRGYLQELQRSLDI